MIINKTFIVVKIQTTHYYPVTTKSDLYILNQQKVLESKSMKEKKDHKDILISKNEK